MILKILFYISIFVLTTLLGRKFWSPKTQKCVTRLPPSPKELPIIGHLHLLNNTPHQTFHNLCARYGPLIHLRLGSVICIIASTPELAKELLITNGHTFASRPVNIAINLLTYNSVDFVFAPYGSYWKFMKKIVASELLGDQTLAQLKDIRFDEASQLIHFLLNKARTGTIVNLSQEVTKVSNNIITRMMWNIRCSGEDEQAKEIRNLVRDSMEILAQFNLSDFIGILRNIDLQGIRKRAKNIHLRSDALLEAIMKKREEVRNEKKEKTNMSFVGGDHKINDFLNILLDTLEDEESKIRLTRENIKAFMFDILTAGTDTSGIVVEWAMSELINHPTILQKAIEEIDSVVGKNRLVKESDIQDLPYLQAIFKETLRLHPPIPIFDRESTEDCNIAGYDIPAKTILFINNCSICRDPKNWKNPLEFQPERFMSGSEGDDNQNLVDVKGQHFILLPFGTGRRGCPGMSLVVHLVPTIMALLIQCFDWKPACNDNGVTPKVVDMTERPGFTVPKAYPLMVMPSTRLNPFPISP
ncbi:hypothetical protein AQUCO_00700720v1 [Aquilegia coerulea]|uniref:Uncharacterized protein n=1 Tax=Aquilegia coerulea TaxID=218851 RepID=A0A2G5ELE1_AQUCA|nr:hypothetical protein AQUCO_00700720v1 [Aquilegia coerulea]